MAKIKLPKVEDLFTAGVHFGHQVRRWNPKMEKYIFAQRSGIHIIDLGETHKGLGDAAEFLKEVASEGKQIIFIGTKRQAKDIIESEANRSGALYVSERWLGGTITNFRIIRRNIDKLVDFKNKKETGGLDMYTKKERLLIDRQIAKLERSVGGVVGLQGKPAAIFVVDARREKTAIKEAKVSKIPVVALIDTNSDPTDVSYPIPGNDDAIRSIAAITKVIGDAIEEGYASYAKKSVKEAEERAKAAEDAAKAAAKEVEEAAKEKVKITGTQSPHASKDIGKEDMKKAMKTPKKVKASKDVKKAKPAKAKPSKKESK
ncbi:30S ribosomal protein S2 [candidate division WWE3 bacterium]|jgi:small subunit ribosomal protein S2|nr:30S ribosomal protein S2 [candidate division WWE3 bacterium]MBT7350746.1 30S ribosomal protein S2 [candidate division WWE3 bacterium]